VPPYTTRHSTPGATFPYRCEQRAAAASKKLPARTRVAHARTRAAHGPLCTRASTAEKTRRAHFLRWHRCDGHAREAEVGRLPLPYVTHRDKGTWLPLTLSFRERRNRHICHPVTFERVWRGRDECRRAASQAAGRLSRRWPPGASAVRGAVPPGCTSGADRVHGRYGGVRVGCILGTGEYATGSFWTTARTPGVKTRTERVPPGAPPVAGHVRKTGPGAGRLRTRGNALSTPN